MSAGNLVKQGLKNDLENQLIQFKGSKIALIRFSEPSHLLPENSQFILSAKGDINEAAVNLFRILRETDSAGFELIIGQKAPETGLGRAINDRLKRAAKD